MLARFVTLDEKQNKIVVWITVYTNQDFFKQAQLLIDNLSSTKDFHILTETEAGERKLYNFDTIVKTVYGLRKRTLEERLQDLFTGNDKRKAAEAK